MTALVLAATAAHAGAWTQPKGEGYAKLDTRVLAGSQGFDAAGEVRSTGRFVDLSLTAYGEVGLTDDLTATYTGTPIGRASYEGAAGPYLGPNAIGLRQSLWSEHLQVAVEARVGWAEPFSDVDLAARAASSATPEGWSYVPAVGNHFVDLELQLGRGLGRFWFSGSIGGRSNTNEAMSSAVIGFAQAGVVVREALVFDLHLPFYLPTEPVTSVNIAGVGHTAYVGAGFGASWWALDRLGLHLGAEGAPYAASNAAALSLTLGIEVRS